MSSPPTNTLTPDILKTLSNYTACDIADALLKLKVPNAGFIADLTPYCLSSATKSPTSATKRTIQIAPASTIHFVDKTSTPTTKSNIPADTHWVDLTVPESFVVASQPAGQTNAVLGGIMAQRMGILNAAGVVIHGRIRDLEELRATGLTIWAKGTSVVGSGGSAKAHAVNVPVDIGGVEVVPGDFVFSDSEAGVIVIPQANLMKVVEMLPKLTGADDKVKEAVAGGMSVGDAFAKFR